jgi:hypothetical protein
MYSSHIHSLAAIQKYFWEYEITAQFRISDSLKYGPYCIYNFHFPLFLQKLSILSTIPCPMKLSCISPSACLCPLSEMLAQPHLSHHLFVETKMVFISSVKKQLLHEIPWALPSFLWRHSLFLPYPLLYFARYYCHSWNAVRSQRKKGTLKKIYLYCQRIHFQI